MPDHLVTFSLPFPSAYPSCPLAGRRDSRERLRCTSVHRCPPRLLYDQPRVTPQYACVSSCNLKVGQCFNLLCRGFRLPRPWRPLRVAPSFRNLLYPRVPTRKGQQGTDHDEENEDHKDGLGQCQHMRVASGQGEHFERRDQGRDNGIVSVGVAQYLCLGMAGRVKGDAYIPYPPSDCNSSHPSTRPVSSNQDPQSPPRCHHNSHEIACHGLDAVAPHARSRRRLAFRPSQVYDWF